MKKTASLALILGLIGLFSARAEPPAGNVGIESLGWLAGSWSGEIQGAGSATRFEALYTRPEGGVILSTSKAFSQEGKLVWFELERFQVQDGLLQLVPYPNGTASVPFTLAEYDAAAKKAVFTNPQHDYPTRITYQQVAEDRLLFIVAGGEGAPVFEIRLSRQP